MLLAVISTSYALYQSTQVKLVPYIVEVDKLGTAASTGFPQQIEYADPRVVRATLGSFVSNFRSVTPDAVVQKQYIDRTYALLRTSDPSTAEDQRLVPRQLALRQGKERHRRHRGEQHRAALEPELPDRLDRIRARPEGQGDGRTPLSRCRDGYADPAAGRGVIRLNPIGLYLRDFDWTAQL
jgi:type IV secretory pathway TrbF-like protein